MQHSQEFPSRINRVRSSPDAHAVIDFVSSEGCRNAINARAWILCARRQARRGDCVGLGSAPSPRCDCLDWGEHSRRAISEGRRERKFAISAQSRAARCLNARGGVTRRPTRHVAIRSFWGRAASKSTGATGLASFDADDSGRVLEVRGEGSRLPASSFLGASTIK